MGAAVSGLRPLSRDSSLSLPYAEQVSDPEENEPELLTVEEIAERLNAPSGFVAMTLDRDGINPVNSPGSWLKRHTKENLRYRRDEIERWISDQTTR